MRIFVAIALAVLGFGRITLAHGDGVDHLALGSDMNLMIGVGMVAVAALLVFSGSKSKVKSK